MVVVLLKLGPKIIMGRAQVPKEPGGTMLIRVLLPRLGHHLTRRPENGGLVTMLVNAPTMENIEKWNRQVVRRAPGCRRVIVVNHQRSGVDTILVKKVGAVIVVAVMIVGVVKVNAAVLVIVIVLASEVVVLVVTGRRVPVGAQQSGLRQEGH